MEQHELLRRVTAVLEQIKISHLLVGSYGSAAWGEPRFTRDIDIVVALTPDDVPALERAFPFPEYYLSTEAAQDAIRRGGQFNVIHPTSGNKVDFILARRDAWGRSQLARRRKVELEPGLRAYVAAPEDVIISKMDYYREGGSEKHLRDITGILRVSGQEVDRAYVAKWARSLELDEIWQAILRRLGESVG